MLATLNDFSNQLPELQLFKMQGFMFSILHEFSRLPGFYRRH